jgi:hypothetical protein
MSAAVALPAVEAVVARAADAFTRTLQRYSPWLRPDRKKQHSGNTERNLSFQLALGFFAIYGDAAFGAMEVPLLSKGGSYKDHLDAYLFAPPLAVLLECKVHSGNDSLSGVVKDMGRMTPGVLSLIRRRHKGPDPSEAVDTVSMVLVEAWGRGGSCTRRWLERAAGKNLSGEKFPADWHYEGREIFQASSNSDGTLYWLYAYKRLLEG